MDVLWYRWVQTVVCQKLNHIRGNWGKTPLGFFSCRSVNVWVGMGRAAAPSQLLHNRLAFRCSLGLAGHWRRMECWPQGPVSLLSSGGGGWGLLDDRTGKLQFLRHSSVDCLKKALKGERKNGTQGHKGYESCGLNFGQLRARQFSISELSIPPRRGLL